MCGLVGIISPYLKINTDLLTTMRDRLTHRGPDSAGLWFNDKKTVGFGHRRLSIIDKDVLANQEFTNIMASIGLILGQPAELSDLRFSNIVFLADSDVDGGHINTFTAQHIQW